MLSTKGSHDSTRDFPLKDAPKYPTSTNCELEFDFGDLGVMVPGAVMHYLDDSKSLGWEHGWKPPQYFIDRVMKGGEVKFSGVRGSRSYTVPHATIGYLSWGLGDKSGELVDTHGGDMNIEQATLAERGPVPPQFIERMHRLVEHAMAHGKRIGEVHSYENDADTLYLPPAPGYEARKINLPEARPLSYHDRFLILWHQAMEADGTSALKMFDERPTKHSALHYDSCRVAGELKFFSLDKENAVAKITLAPRYCGPYDATRKLQLHLDGAFNEQLQNKIRMHFKQMGIDTDKIDFPYIRVSGRNLEKLKQLGAEIIELQDPPTLEEKIAVVSGAKPARIEIKPDAFGVEFSHSDGGALAAFKQRYDDRLYRAGNISGGSSIQGNLWVRYGCDTPIGEQLVRMIETDFEKENFVAELQQRLLGLSHLPRAGGGIGSPFPPFCP